MPTVTKGTAHLHGVAATVANATISEINLEDGYGLDQKTPDESGVTIENRLDDEVITGSITVFAQTGFTAAKGDIITLANLVPATFNKTYLIKSVGAAFRAGDKVQMTLNLECHAGIDYDPA